MLKMLTSFLSVRSHFVSVNAVQTKQQPLTCGVPER